jgi:arylsulfatase A-like enzyme
VSAGPRVVRLLAAGLAAIVSAACAPDDGVGTGAGDIGRDATTARHVVLVTLDTVRADRIGAYGRSDAGTPWLDSLASRGRRFDRAYAHVPITLPSHVSMMTGLLPPATGVHANGQTEVAPDVEFVAERFRHAGFRTVAAVGGFPVASAFPVARGFETFDDRFVDRRNPSALERPAEAVVDAAVRALAPPDDRRTFLWVHLFDAHDPYEPGEPWASRHRDDPYQGEIAAMDAALARLARALEPVLPAGETLWCVIADHGEALGDHGEPTHGFFLYEPTVRVPWILAGPGVPPGTVQAAPVGAVDVAPTLLAAAGLDVSPGLVGRDRSRPTDAEAAVYLETELPRRNYGWAPLRGVVEGRFKWIEAPRPELYDVVDDPDESFNQVAEWPDEVARLREVLARTPGGGAGLTPPASVTDPRLASLGYVGAVSPSATGAEDPKDRLATYVRFQEASRALEADPPRPEEALPLLDTLIAEEDTGAARLKRAVARRMLGRLEDALRDLDVARGLSPEDPGVALETGRIRLLTGNPAASVEPLTRFLDANAGSPEGLLLRGAALEKSGRIDVAERDYRAALAGNPGYRDASLRLAALLYRAGRFEEVRTTLETHLAIHPGDPLATGLMSELP